jgi:hypothetical protein
MKPYSDSVEEKMRIFFASLKEDDKRRYAALEAEKIGWGGQIYIKRLLGCDFKTTRKGSEELEGKIDVDFSRSRREGAGRKPKKNDETVKGIFLDVLSEHTAGSPMEDGTLWTYLTQTGIADAMKEKGADVSRYVVKQLLAGHGYVKRKSQKKSHG